MKLFGRVQRASSVRLNATDNSVCLAVSTESDTAGTCVFNTLIYLVRPSMRSEIFTSDPWCQHYGDYTVHQNCACVVQEARGFPFLQEVARSLSAPPPLPINRLCIPR